MQGLLRIIARLLVAVYLAFLTPEAEAARWQRDVVVVRDYTSGRQWGLIVERQVDALNAALPDGAPRFVYEDAGERPCEEIDRTRPGISVCVMERLSRPAEASVTRRKETIREALIYLRHDQLRVGHNRVCHELMHAVTAIADSYQAEAGSCVRGNLGTFGAWDIAHLANEYDRDRR